MIPSPPLTVMSSALADADPLGPNQSVTFDEVGGLDERRLLMCVFVDGGGLHVIQIYIP